jgi:hypothetical protein
MIITKIIDGIIKNVETIHYPSTGRVTERVLDPQTNEPEDVRVIKEGNTPSLDFNNIHNQEYLLYSHFTSFIGKP